jgi:hypothetical protein
MTVPQEADEPANGVDSFTTCADLTAGDLVAEPTKPSWSGFVIATTSEQPQPGDDAEVPLLTDYFECANLTCLASNIVEVPAKSYMMCAACGTSTCIEFRIPANLTTTCVQKPNVTNYKHAIPSKTLETGAAVLAAKTTKAPAINISKTVPLSDWSMLLRALDKKTPAYLRDWIKSCPCCGVSFSLNLGRLVMECHCCGHTFCWMCFADYERVWAEGEHAHRLVCPLYRPFEWEG